MAVWLKRGALIDRLTQHRQVRRTILHAGLSH